jgi:hypothetical protein
MPRFEKGHAPLHRNGSHSLGRVRLCKRLLNDLLADWEVGGADAIKMMRMERPAEYCRMMASILPKELLFESGSVSELADDELDQMITMLRERALAERQEQALELEKVPEQKLLNGH